MKFFTTVHGNDLYAVQHNLVAFKARAKDLAEKIRKLKKRLKKLKAKAKKKKGKFPGKGTVGWNPKDRRC